ncbi:chaperone modulator CbpM [Shewanella sp. SG41-4]|uniref:chaperone modulator CbpM n=1 Tax=Shewanella sp. SG41-4 TaxID=2760976 RepID=UPI0015FFFBA8|nr:chaperone modulator CbpM [Shewanella sp. SG41-4]MBB1440754.1 chaperone modulator CbpM [Shewanella sp. SG41-4]
MLQINISEHDCWLSSDELCQCIDISSALLLELVEHSIAMPLEGEVIEQWRFSVANLHQIKKATRIQRDLALDWSGIALILQLLDEREMLEQEVDALKQQLNRFKV